jgi:predicted ATP-grasp superfamily ATP-dependent carboligase
LGTRSKQGLAAPEGLSAPLPAADLPYAVVACLDSMQGLQIARLLAANGVPIIGLARDPSYHTCRTRVCTRILNADTHTDELVKSLTELGPLLPGKAVVIPCHDESVLVVSRNREHLERWYHIMLPDADTVEMMMHKERFVEYAQQLGFSIPTSVELRSRGDAERAALTLPFPCVVKPPYRSQAWTRHTKMKAIKVDDPASLLEAFDNYHEWSGKLLAQQWIEGPDDELYSFNGYFDRTSALLAGFVSRKIRQWPPGMGSSTSGEECRNDYVRDQAIRFFRSAAMVGLAYMEMKRDVRSGEYYMIEPNVGRPTGRSAIAETGGVELHYTMYCDAAGLPLPENRTQTYMGAKWIHVLRDLQAALYYRRRGQLTWRQWLKTLRGKRAYALFSWKDPLPFLAALARSVPAALSQRERDSASNRPGSV